MRNQTWIIGALAMLLCVGGLRAQNLVVLDGAPAGLDRPMQRVDLRGTPAVDALAWWAQTAGVNMIVSWKQLQADGFDPQQPVVLQLHGVSARTVLRMLMTQIFNSSDEVIAEATKEYVRIRPRRLADQDKVVKVYSIGDMVQPVPDFKGPSFDLTQVMSDQGKGGSGSSLFNTQTEIAEEVPTTRAQRAQTLIDTIQKLIYPDVWDVNGGTSSIKYYDNRLIVSAPEYVHQRIGIPDPINLTAQDNMYRHPEQWKSGDADAFPPGYRNYVGFSMGGQAGAMGPRSWQSSVAGGSTTRPAGFSSYSTGSDAAYYAQPYYRRAVFGGSNGIASVRPKY